MISVQVSALQQLSTLLLKHFSIPAFHASTRPRKYFTSAASRRSEAGFHWIAGARLQSIFVDPSESRGVFLDCNPSYRYGPPSLPLWPRFAPRRRPPRPPPPADCEPAPSARATRSGGRAGPPPLDAGGRAADADPPPAPCDARRDAFSLARFRSSAFRARISAIRSAIGTSKRCLGLLA